MNPRLARHTIVLLGIGHTNAHIVRHWKMKPVADCQLVCISNFPVATYSGMLPGVLSGQYSRDSMQIDLRRLCGSAGVRLVTGDWTALDRSERLIHFRERAPIAYDWLSIGIGSRPTFSGVDVATDALLVAIKPMQTFLDRLQFSLQPLVESGRQEIQIAIVGGGVGSIETALCLAERHRLARLQRPLATTDNLDQTLAKIGRLSVVLVTAAGKIAGGMTDSARKRIAKELDEKKISVITGQRIHKVGPGTISADGHPPIDADLVIWATGAKGLDVLAATGLPLDERGFLLTRQTLQSTGDDRIFAVGDSGTMKTEPTEKAGVFAVRQGPILWENLQRAVAGQTLTEYEPQRDFLKLLNLGDGRAIGQYRGWSFSGRWAWWMKDRIDRRFMAMYQDYSRPDMQPLHADPPEMRCVGCGGKIPGDLLHEALASARSAVDPNVVEFGGSGSDDSAIVRMPENRVTVSTDFFVSPVDDPWLAGRIAVNNATSDLYVMGARPVATLAMLQIPLGHPRGQLRLMQELMRGVCDGLASDRTSLAGGHTIEGDRLALGFTVLGDQVVPPLGKVGLRDGDLLVLSKPLGTGTLLASLMQNLLSGRDCESLTAHLLVGNAVALDLATNCRISAMTDVTGFGLAGHLSEMLRPAGLSATIERRAVPLLSGFDELTRNGVTSTMVPGNQAFSVRVQDARGQPADAVLTNALFDPQTCGGILLGCDEADSGPVLELLQRSGHSAAAIIGRVNAVAGESCITLR